MHAAKIQAPANVPVRTPLLRTNPRALVLPRDATKAPILQLASRPVNKDWSTGLQDGVSCPDPKVTEDRDEGTLRGLSFSGDISSLRGGYEAIIEKYLSNDELSSVERIEFRNTYPSNDEVAETVCGLVSHTEHLKEFGMHNCGAPSAQGWMKMLRKTQGWRHLRKFSHTGDNVASVLLGSEFAYRIPAVPGLDDDALLTMARHIACRRPWLSLEELTLENIVYPVHEEVEDPNENFYLQTDGRDAIEEFSSHVWMKLKQLNLDSTGLESWTSPSDLCKDTQPSV